MIWGVIVLALIAGAFLAQWGAGKVAGEKLKEANRDVEAATRIAEANINSPTDKRGLIGRLLDKSASL